MKRILFAVVAALGLALGSGTALAQHNGGGGHSSGGWHGGGGHGGGWHGGHGGSHFNIGIGFPGFYWGPGWGYPYYGYYGYPYYASYPYYAGYPSYYSDEPVYADPAPGTYIQRDMNSGTPSRGAPVGEGQYSYYCPDPAGYYPQLQNCPKGWLKVVPDAGPRPRTQ
jgi:hypothetical protein